MQLSILLRKHDELGSSVDGKVCPLDHSSLRVETLAAFATTMHLGP